MSLELFKNRRLVIATKHGKEQVIGPLFEMEFGLTCFVADNFDTDSLGTFTGEVERTMDPLTTARKKCLMAMEANHCDMAIASEGSFGPHPTIPFIPADDEWLFFIDRKNGLEIYAREISTATNFYAEAISTTGQLSAFMERANFPSHGLIVRKSAHETADMVKGIADADSLHQVFNRIKNKYGEAYIETDMRAMHNPSRMLVIETAAKKLASKIKSCCPQCNTPGFGITDAKIGLPCRWCGTATQSVLSYVYRCTRCNYVQEELYPNKKKFEEPALCNECNP